VAIVQVQRRWPGSEHVQVCALISSLGIIACAPSRPDFERAYVRTYVRACVRAGGRAGVRACVHFCPAPFCEASSAGLLSCRTLSLHRCIYCVASRRAAFLLRRQEVDSSHCLLGVLPSRLVHLSDPTTTGFAPSASTSERACSRKEQISEWGLIVIRQAPHATCSPRTITHDPNITHGPTLTPNYDGVWSPRHVHT
jgi:hypothetical protein